MGAAADIVGQLLGLHVAESPFDIRLLVRRMVLRVADTAELWAVGRAFFSALCPDNESMEQRVATFSEARVGRSGGWMRARGLLPLEKKPGPVNDCQAIQTSEGCVCR